MVPKRPYSEFKEEIEELGFILKTEESEYKGARSKIIVLCKCKEPWLTQLSDLKKPGRCCKKCGILKRSSTRQEESGMFSNFTDFFEELGEGYVFQNNKDEFIAAVKAKKSDKSIRIDVEFTCPSGHANVLELSSFKNKKVCHRKAPFTFCIVCKIDEDKVGPRNNRLSQIYKIFDKFNHVLLTLGDDNKEISFICGNCEVIGSTNFKAISRDEYTGKCNQCSDKYRANYTKIFTWDDKAYYIMGYEDKALQYLKDNGYTNSNVLAGINDDVPIIQYRIGSRVCEYHPDIYVKNEHKIIEVKSHWTLCNDKNFKHKSNATKDNYTYELWVFEKYKSNPDIYTFIDGNLTRQ
jgi:hypothetical protein